MEYAKTQFWNISLLIMKKHDWVKIGSPNGRRLSVKNGVLDEEKQECNEIVTSNVDESRVSISW